MDAGFRCPRCGFGNQALTAVSHAVLAISSERSVGRTLRRIVETSRSLAAAEFAALGIPHEDGGFAEFITSGMSDEQVEAIGRLPRDHGMLGALVADPTPVRSPDIRTDPRFGGWPGEHPEMTSFLGVPIVADGAIVGAFYLTNKVGAPAFSAADQEAIELLAPHAAAAIEAARLYERSQELSIVEERNRLARELHDSVSQTLFSVVLTAEAAATLVERDPTEARERILALKALARGALGEMRSLIFELRSAEIERDGLVPTLRQHASVLTRVSGVPIEVTVEGERRLAARIERQLYRVAQEALGNAIKHAGASKVSLRLAMEGSGVALRVADDGTGFDPVGPGVRSKRLGLTSMEERACSLGAAFRIDSSPGKGTAVCLDLET